MPQLKRFMATEDTDHQCREVVLKEFPQVRQELEECIAQLHALADKVDKVHRHCAISNVVSSSAGAVSGILTIAGLSLAPVAAGASLVLAATGAGLGAAAAVTRLFTSIAEVVENQSAKDKVRRLVPTGIKEWYMVKENGDQRRFELESLAQSCFKSLQNVVKNVEAYNQAKDNPSLVAKARVFLATGNTSDESHKELQAAFRGTFLAMDTESRKSVRVDAAHSFVADVITLAREAKHLDDGAKAQLAEELRQLAWELESELKKLTQNQQEVERLNKQLHIQREGLMSSLDSVDKRVWEKNYFRELEDRRTFREEILAQAKENEKKLKSMAAEMIQLQEVKANLEKAKQTLEHERGELAKEVKVLLQGKWDSEHKWQKVEAQLQALQVKFKEGERNCQPPGLGAAPCSRSSVLALFAKTAALSLLLILLFHFVFFSSSSF
ncbi:apolipoprotein L2-like isoform X2 [Artibeus jamaicensis]|nr:apolipoprotein L2-like isoform X2 [Artibeus jamaicensis]